MDVTAVIMAGGKGSRLASVNSKIPKPMMPIDGKPILEYQIESLKKQGITDYILVVGYLHEIIENYFGTGERFGVSISYVVENVPLGTAGAFYMLQNLVDRTFLLINGDIIFDVDIARLRKAHEICQGIATIFTHPNSHPYDSAIVVSDKDGKVIDWLNKEEKRGWYRNRVNAGIHMFSPRVFQWLREKGMITKPEKLDLDRVVFKLMIKEGELFAYNSPEYVKDMGTPERYEMVIEDVRHGKVEKKNLRHLQRAVFLDRDGTINKYVGFLSDINKFELLDGAAKAIRKMNEMGYLVIVITNQPVIARGEASEEELEEIHRKMETLLGEEGAYIDAIYYCSHHPDRGFPGERLEYKKECQCRKPKPGMILQASQKYHIDLANSWMVGDTDVDILTGIAVGCRTVGVYGCSGQNGMFMDLKEFSENLGDLEINIQMRNDICKLIQNYPELKEAEEGILKALFEMILCYQKGHKMLIGGNGGSDSDSQHIVGELMKSFLRQRKLPVELQRALDNVDEKYGKVLGQKLQGALPAIALSSHSSLNTAFSNDVDPVLCYAQQVYGYGKKGDIFLAISTSGNSENMIYAAVVAKALGMKVISFTGEMKSKLSDYSDIEVRVPGRESYRIQELQVPVYHWWCMMLESIFWQ